MKGLYLLLFIISVMGLGRAEEVPVTKEEASTLVNHLIPLPHEIAVSNAFVSKPDAIGLQLRAGAGEVEKQAFAELQELFKRQVGSCPTGTAWIITVGVMDAEGKVGSIRVEGAERIKTLPNPTQAYLIRPVGANRLVVAGLSAPGVYYGVQTLCQLLEPKMTKEQVVVPLAVVTDWPDMAERGLWNHSTMLIPWLGTLKMNFIRQRLRPVKGPNGEAQCPPLNSAALKAAQTRGFRYVVDDGHVNFWHLNFPELAGKGEKAKCPRSYEANKGICPCTSNPLFKQRLAEWMEDAVHQGAPEVCFWLTEWMPCHCECEACQKAGGQQLLLETRVAVDVWRSFHQKHPDVPFRIFFTGWANNTNEDAACLAVLPPEIKADKPYGFNRPFDEFAEKGRFVASYDAGAVIPRSQNCGLRFQSGEVLRKTIDRYYDHKWSGLYAINGCFFSSVYPLQAVDAQEFSDYFVNAVAEWTWNAKGRDVRQLAVAWATRRGYERPERAGEWVALMEPCEFLLDPVDGTVQRWTAAVRSAMEGFKAGLSPQPNNGAGLPPGRSDRGEGTPAPKDTRKNVYLYGKASQTNALVQFVPGTNELAQAEAACRRALPLVESLTNSSLALETRYVQAIVIAGQTVRRLLAAMNPPAEVSAADRKKAVQIAASHCTDAINAVRAALNQRLTGWPGDPKVAKEIEEKHAEKWQALTDQIAAVGREQP